MPTWDDDGLSAMFMPCRVCGRRVALHTDEEMDECLLGLGYDFVFRATDDEIGGIGGDEVE